jgi:hypothetical protein
VMPMMMKMTGVAGTTMTMTMTMTTSLASI